MGNNTEMVRVACAASRTGEVARARFAQVWQLRDGKVARFEQIVDSATSNQALT